MSMHFDLVDLRLIVRVAEFSSLTRAAESSHISLAAASTRIKNIEESLGTKLLYRSSQGMTLSPPGQTFVQHAMLVLAQIENMHGDMQEFAKGIKGHLRIFANTTSLCEFLPPVLGRYLQSHPDININLRERLSHDIVRAVSEGHTDIGIVAGTVNTENLEMTGSCWWYHAAIRWPPVQASISPKRWIWCMSACTRQVPFMDSSVKSAIKYTGSYSYGYRSATLRQRAV